MLLTLIPSDLDLTSLHSSIFLAVQVLGWESFGSESGRHCCPEDKPVWPELVGPSSSTGPAVVLVELPVAVSLKVVQGSWLSHSLGHGE